MMDTARRVRYTIHISRDIQGGDCCGNGDIYEKYVV